MFFMLLILNLFKLFSCSIFVSNYFLFSISISISFNSLFFQSCIKSPQSFLFFIFFFFFS
jgi:hypothetical protein